MQRSGMAAVVARVVAAAAVPQVEQSAAMAAKDLELQSLRAQLQQQKQ
jgi:hypothetical protein